MKTINKMLLLLTSVTASCISLNTNAATCPYTQKQWNSLPVKTVITGGDFSGCVGVNKIYTNRNVSWEFRKANLTGAHIFLPNAEIVGFNNSVINNAKISGFSNFMYVFDTSPSFGKNLDIEMSAKNMFFKNAQLTLPIFYDYKKTGKSTKIHIMDSVWTKPRFVNWTIGSGTLINSQLNNLYTYNTKFVGDIVSGKKAVFQVVSSVKYKKPINGGYMVNTDLTWFAGNMYTDCVGYTRVYTYETNPVTHITGIEYWDTIKTRYNAQENCGALSAKPKSFIRR